MRRLFLKRVKKIILVLVSLAILSLTSLVIYINILIQSIDVKRITPVDKDYYEFADVSLEEGSTVDTKELEDFFLFSKQRFGFSKFISVGVEKQELYVMNKNELLIKRDLSLNGPYNNDCDLIYCLQKRVAFKNIPSIFWKALIGIEDLRFTDHIGIDFKSLARALWVDIINLKFVQGGSTLTQQLVKNMYLSNERSLIRKFNEMIIAVYLENKLDKEQILESYFNEFIWGSLQGVKVKGIYSASIFYFQKKPKELNHYEASILISLLKGPYFYHPINRTDRLKDRTNLVYHKLIELKLFPGENTEVWTDKQWNSWKVRLEKNNKDLNLYNLWLSLKNNSEYLNSFEQYIFYNNSRRILNFARERAGLDNIGVKAIVGRIDNPQERFLYYSKYERDLNGALKEERHQVGSTLKPIIYSFFLEEGSQFSDLVSVEPISLKLKSGTWSPAESHKIVEAQVTLGSALLDSLNRPLIRLSQKYKFELIEEKLRSYIPNLLSPLSEYPAQLLGAVELSMEELFEIYSKFLKKECSESVFEDLSVLALLSDPTKTTVRRVVGETMGKLKFFGKTGTSNNGYDNWFVAFDGKELAVIWVGYEGPRDKGHFKLYGSNTSFRLFKSFSQGRGKQFNELECAWNSDPI